MSGRTLTVVRAGAGSGKTYNICQEVADRVVHGLDPARVLATTFTRKAAAELKGRIQQRLLHEERLTPERRVELAQRLDLAPIGTVHSVGHHLAARHALRLGLSPRLDVLDEQGTTRTLERLLEELDGAAEADLTELRKLARRLSQRKLNDLVLKLLECKRGNRIGDDDFRAQLEGSAARLCGHMAPHGPSADAPGFVALARAAKRALQEIDELIQSGVDETDTTKKALPKLRALARGGAEDWEAFRTAYGLAAGKRSGADAALAPLRERAERVLAAPALHDDLTRFAGLLARCVLALEHAYAESKRERGLADYVDLELFLLDLLGHPDHAAHLADDVDLVVVDEFQDTNPLQLAIFERLLALGLESRWVGDAKQAIYGFRGTDPELVQAVVAATGTEPENLPKNWRSNASLVRFVGRVFEPIFDAEANLEPHRPPAPAALERWCLSGNKKNQFAEIAAGIAALVPERVPRFGDVAVLTRSNRDAADVAAACEARGIPVLLNLAGLLSTREGALALAALRFLADRSDSLAAATVLHLLEDEPPVPAPPWLQRRLEHLARRDDTTGSEERPPDEWYGEAPIDTLRALDVNRLAPSDALRMALETLDVPTRLAAWGEPAQRAANLDTLLALAADYEQAAPAAGAAPTLAGLVIHLEKLAADERDHIRPPAGIDAVTVSTYHRAKGLEWPVVVLTGSDTRHDPDLFSPSVTGGAPGSDDPLAGRQLRFWPWPFGGGTPYSSRGAFKPLDNLALASPEADDARARDAGEDNRLLYVGFTRARNVLILAATTEKATWLEPLQGLDALVPPGPPGGWDPGATTTQRHEVDLPDLDTTCILRRLHPEAPPAAGGAGEEPDARPTADTAEETRATGDPASRRATPGPAWIAPPPAISGAAHPPRFVNPSRIEGEPSGKATKTDPHGPPLPVRITWTDDDPQRRFGDAVHAYLASLPSCAALDDDHRLQIARRCLEAHDVPSAVDPAALVQAGGRLHAWVTEHHPGARWHTEVPLVAPRTAGGHWRGTADLLLERPDGALVLVDHKAGPFTPAGIETAAAAHAPQLAAYREALTAQGHPVTATWLHFPIAGVMVEVAQ